MGQLWDRLRRYADVHLNDKDDGRDWSAYNFESLRAQRARAYRDPDEERLAREIEELSKGQPQQEQSGTQNAPNDHARRDEAPPRRGGAMSADEAFSTLGLARSASVDEVKSAYKKLMLQHHPDRVTGTSAETQFAAAEKAQRINQAYQTLKDTMRF